MKVEITVNDNEAIMSTPMGGNVYSNSIIISKEAFIECYEKWVKPRKHGRWIEVQRINPTDRMAICECSICGDTVWVYDGQRTWNYCPNCGARMNEVEE